MHAATKLISLFTAGTDRRRLLRCALVTALGLAWLAAPISATSAAAQNTTGLPLPRYVSLRAGEVNMRTGPGIQYPVEWSYNRRDLPVEIIAEFETWRKVRDWQGTQGWVHQSLLSGKRTIIVTGEIRNLRSRPEASSRVVARLEPGVIGDLGNCSAGWCKVTAGGYQGWLRHVDMWGVYKEEAFK